MAARIFRLKNTPLGTVLVKFYRVVPYSPDAFERHLLTEHLRMEWGETRTVLRRSGKALYQGLVLRNPVLMSAVAKLAERCPACNCVRIEPELLEGMHR